MTTRPIFLKYQGLQKYLLRQYDANNKELKVGIRDSKDRYIAVVDVKIPLFLILLFLHFIGKTNRLLEILLAREPPSMGVNAHSKCSLQKCVSTYLLKYMWVKLHVHFKRRKWRRQPMSKSKKINLAETFRGVKFYTKDPKIFFWNSVDAPAKA